MGVVASATRRAFSPRWSARRGSAGDFLSERGACYERVCLLEWCSAGVVGGGSRRLVLFGGGGAGSTSRSRYTWVDRAQQHSPERGARHRARRRSGANVTITADWSDIANNSACPCCIDNLPVAFQGFGAQPAGCIENNSSFGNRSGTGTVSLGAAPTTTGIYNIVGNFEQTFFCGQFWTVPNAYPVIAQVIVGCTQIVSGTISAPLQIGAGVTCIIGGTIAGSVSISAGAVLIATGATISGPLRGQGAAQIVVCDSSIAGPVSVSGSTGSVRIGSATAGGSPHVAATSSWDR